MMTSHKELSTQYFLLKSEDGQGENYLLLDAGPVSVSRNFKICSASVGLLVGFLVQMTTLGANVVIWEVWGDDFANTTRKEIIAFSLLWSFVTSAIAIITLGFLRALLSSFYRSLPIQRGLHDLTEKVHDQMLECMEILFVVGALVGVSLAWVVTDMLLGMQPQINFSVSTLALALLWCKAVFWLRYRDAAQPDDDADDEFDDDDDLFVSPKGEQPIMVV